MIKNDTERAPVMTKYMRSPYFNICTQQYVNPKRAVTELGRFIIVNIMVADALAPCVARTSAPMILTT